MVNAGRYTKTVFNCSDHAIRIVPVDTAFEMFDFFPFSFVLFRFLSRTSQIHVIRYTEGSWGSRRRLFWLLGFYSLKGFPMYNSPIEPRPHGPAFGRCHIGIRIYHHHHYGTAYTLLALRDPCSVSGRMQVGTSESGHTYFKVVRPHTYCSLSKWFLNVIPPGSEPNISMRRR